jgi:hypothetical protein
MHWGKPFRGWELNKIMNIIYIQIRPKKKSGGSRFAYPLYSMDQQGGLGGLWSRLVLGLGL